jgi:hypothetical protein
MRKKRGLIKNLPPLSYLLTVEKRQERRVGFLLGQITGSSNYDNRKARFLEGILFGRHDNKSKLY